MKFKLGFSGLRWQTPDLDEILGQLKETGWDGWEIRQSLDWLGSASRVRAISDRAGVQVAVVTGGGISLDGSHEMKERNKRRIDFAADVEADTFMFMGANRPYGRSSTPTTSGPWRTCPTSLPTTHRSTTWTCATISIRAPRSIPARNGNCSCA